MEDTQLQPKTPTDVQRSEHTENSDSQLRVTIFFPQGTSGDVWRHI